MTLDRLPDTHSAQSVGDAPTPAAWHQGGHLLVQSEPCRNPFDGRGFWLGQLGDSENTCREAFR
jgi:hypothetical protein